MARARWHSPGLVLALAVLISASGLARSTRAQVVDDEDEVENQAVQQNFMIDESNFDIWVFGRPSLSGNVRTRLEALLTLKIAEIDRVARLTDAQKKKLELAAHGDIQRFFDKVAEKRKAFELVRHDRQKFAEIFQQLMPLQQAYNKGLFHADSIFAKTVKKTLDDRQAADFDALNAKRRRFQQQGRLGHLLATLDTNLALDRQQRQRFLKFVVEETRSPRDSTAFDDYIILYQLAQLPEERVKLYFRDPQWPIMRQLLAHSLSYKQRMKSQGILPGESSDEPWIVSVDFESPSSTSIDKKNVESSSGK
ncbi:hypothetical protein V5E97_28005 [Singulisphaera sp. Ch08]|uniref:Uncharacterized protein n=1 Tax=Singulisphaera sp. Ch08 TaxID=3120278 RepID=A0AAU7CAJ8_9BACT